MTRRTFRRAAVVAATALALSVAVPGAGEAEEPEGQGSDNLTHLANVQFPDLRAEGASSSVAATDSDFVEFTIPADGWSRPDESQNGGIAVPETYDPRPGETRTFNLMGTYDNGMFVTDVTDPEQPVVVARWDCGVLQADVFVFDQTDDATGDQRTYAAYSLDATSDVVPETECARTLGVAAGDQGTFVAEVTDPYRPRSVSFLTMRKGSHQTTVHPSGDYIYNSAAVLGDPDLLGSIEVYDVSDPQAPELVHDLPLQTGLDSHDMTFNAEGTRLYSAALTHSLIIDTTDPAEPSIVGRVIDPAVNIHHDAHAVTVDTAVGEKQLLLVGDELAGAAGNGFCPGGGIHVYDITGELEQAPVKVGAFFIPDLRPAGLGGDSGEALRCTAHVITVLPEQQLLVMAWYNAGVRILDYSGLADLAGAGVSLGAGNETLTPGIRQIGWHRFPDSDLWSAQVHEVGGDGSFAIFGGDVARHLDIWRFDPAAGTASDPGRWLAGAAASAASATDLLGAGRSLETGYVPFCLLGAAGREEA